jgi:hypothetical protein
MSTCSPERLEELEDLERLAWTAYKESLRDLDGADYDIAEELSWDDLQRTLADLEAERGSLTAADAAA